MEEKKRKALEWVEKQIKETRQALGRAEYRPGVKPEELENLRGKLELLEWISGAVLRTEMSQPQWISVDDRLQEEEREVLCYLGNSIAKVMRVCFLRYGEWRDDSGWPVPTVTHWMPLPEAPKEEAE